VDTTFNPPTGANDAIYSISVQPDANVIIAGQFTVVNLAARNRIARLKTDGTLDLTFNPGSSTNAVTLTGFDNTVYATAIQNDGRILASGVFTNYHGTRRIGIARLMANGNLDTTFMDTGFNQFAGVPGHTAAASANTVLTMAIDNTATC